MTTAPAPVCINRVALLRPPYQWKDRLAKLFPVVGQGILDPGRDLGEGFPVNQVLSLEILQHIRQRLGTNPVQPLLDIVEPDPFMVPDDADDQDRPLLRDDVDDALEGTEADVVTFFFHSHYIPINWTALILPN